MLGIHPLGGASSYFQHSVCQNYDRIEGWCRRLSYAAQIMSFLTGRKKSSVR